MSGAYYNEFDPFAAAWLRELIKAGHIPAGEVDERDMREVHPDDLRGFTQHHFFAGIGGWAYAARLAGWPDDRPLFTGSPPCQPFSSAGKQLGAKDDRHLAPHWLELVRAVRPPFVAGEQVAAAVNKDAWLDDLLDALEAEDYATGAIVLPACGIGAPHIRQRIFFVGRLGDGEYAGLERLAGHGDDRDQPGRLDTQPGRPITEAGAIGGMGNSSSIGRQQQPNGSGSDGARMEQAGGKQIEFGETGGDILHTEPTDQITPGWNNPDWLRCRDGKWRPVESGTFPLANGVPARVGRLRGYGNAIVPQVAAEVLRVLAP